MTIFMLHSHKTFQAPIRVYEFSDILFACVCWLFRLSLAIGENIFEYVFFPRKHIVFEFLPLGHEFVFVLFFAFRFVFVIMCCNLFSLPLIVFKETGTIL